jgi:dTDP-4-dehydrorhamnose reductase
MVGSHFVASERCRVAAAGRANPSTQGLAVERFDPVDLTDPSRVSELVRAAPEEVVVNFAARTDVDGIEKERPTRGTPPGGPAWSVNAQAPAAMAAGAKDSGKYFVQISTDFVFDGTAGPYAEDSPVSPLSERLNWYGWTKSEGERLVFEEHPGALILRIAFPYRVGYPAKLDFARWMVARHQEGNLPPLFADQQITPTWVPDLTATLIRLIPGRTAGIVHVSSPDVTTPFEFGRELLSRTRRGTAGVVAGSMAGAPSAPGRAPRPLKGGLRTVRAGELRVPLTSWREGIAELVRGSGERT